MQDLVGCELGVKANAGKIDLRNVYGLLHLAAALNVPLVAIFTGTEPGQHGPLGSGKIEIVGTLGAMPSLEDVGAVVERITC